MIKLWKNIQNLRGAAILCVVFNHAVDCFVGGKAGIVDSEYSILERLIVTFGVTFPFASIAGFMIASGYLMGRFFSNGPAARGAAKKLGIRYAIWSLAGFLAIAAITKEFSLQGILYTLRTSYGPFPAYWFFASLILFYLLCPFLTRWAKERPFSLLAAFGLLECLRAYLLYCRNGFGPSFLVPLQGSYFILGSLLSQHSEAFVFRLKRFRLPILLGAVVLLAAAFAETTYWWDAIGGPIGQTVSADRASVRLFSIVIVCWFLLRETKQSGFYTWLDNLGMNSMTIFLLFDFFQWCTLTVAWHLPSALHGQMPVSVAIAPSYMGNPAWILVYFAAGLLGPLAVAALLERVAGKRWKQFIFS